LAQPVTRIPFSGALGSDPGIELYAKTESRKSVVGFYARVAGSEALARTILEAACAKGISPSLAFSIAWVESNFKTRTVSANTHSVDRGLFQLNSKTFHYLDEKDFFDPAVNAKNGLAYLDYCLSYGGDEIIALAVYNAGLPRILKGAVPKSTYGYIGRVLSYKADLDRRFGNEVVSRWLPRSDF
jgi:soluble lytic murein transglycosylase-like protein